MKVFIFYRLSALFLICVKKTLTTGDNCLMRQPNKFLLNCSCCKTGYNGFNCSEICPNCESRLLQSDNRCLQTCKDGYYGTACHMHCSPNCIEGNSGMKICRKHDGECVNGCVSGHYGQQCNLFCSSDCLRRECVQKDGRCNKCNGNRYYGDYCSIPCPSGCFNNRCAMNGECIDGCKYNYHGETCADLCGINCKNSRCTFDASDGFTCTDGCNTGYYGDTCAGLCGMHCKNRRCTSGLSTGFNCTDGCDEGYTSSNCTDWCPKYCHVCEQYTGSCIICEKKKIKQCENDDCVNGKVICRPVYEIFLLFIPIPLMIVGLVIFLCHKGIRRAEKIKKKIDTEPGGVTGLLSDSSGETTQEENAAEKINMTESAVVYENGHAYITI